MKTRIITEEQGKILVGFGFESLGQEAPKEIKEDGKTYYRGEIELIPENLLSHFGCLRWYYQNKEKGIDSNELT